MYSGLEYMEYCKLITTGNCTSYLLRIKFHNVQWVGHVEGMWITEKKPELCRKMLYFLLGPYILRNVITNIVCTLRKIILEERRLKKVHINTRRETMQ